MSGWKKKRSIMLRYDSTANIYDLRYAEEQEAKYGAALRSLESTRLGSVLDLGCGTGLLFRHIAKNANIIIGLDLSRRALLEAKKRSKDSTRAHLIHADADSLPLKQGVFDHVFAMTLVQNMPRPSQTAREMARVSRDDAVIVVTGLKKIFSKGGFKKLLQDNGLKIEAMIDGEDLKCYVAKCSRSHR